MAEPGNTTVLSVRVSREERALLATAAAQSRTSLSDFVRRTSLEAAEAEVMNRTVVTIPAEHWEAFESSVQSPPEPNPALERLARLTPTWKR